MDMTMRLTASPYERIVNEKKTIEIRLNDPKRQQLALGDHITFKKRPARPKSPDSSTIPPSQTSSTTSP